jgi:hypothetical protein
MACWYVSLVGTKLASMSWITNSDLNLLGPGLAWWRNLPHVRWNQPPSKKMVSPEPGFLERQGGAQSRKGGAAEGVVAAWASNLLVGSTRAVWSSDGRGPTSNDKGPYVPQLPATCMGV